MVKTKDQLASKSASIAAPIKLEIDAESYVRVQCELYEETKDPLYLLEAFIHSIHVERNPPAVILEALAKAFQTVVDSEGNKSLDHVLGLRRKGRGAWNAFTDQKKKGRTYWLTHVIFALTNLRDEDGKRISEAKGADRLSFFLESHPRLKFYKVEGLLDSYSRIWKKRFHFDQVDQADRLHPASWTPARRAAFLKNYPKR